MFEGGLNYETRSFELEATAYYQIINNYIYIGRTLDSVTVQGKNYSRYQFNQQNAVIYGAEGKLALHPANVKWFNYAGTVTFTHGTLANGNPLPLMPPYRVNNEITITKNVFEKIRNTFVRVNGLYAMSQNRTFTNELTTPAYFVLNLGCGGEISAWKQPLQVNIGVNNLLNTQYLDHMSRLRQYGVYNIGFNAFVSVAWKFQTALK